MTSPAPPERPLCPSAQAGNPAAVLIGIIGGTAAQPRVRYTDTALPVTGKLLALTDPVGPAEVLRVAAPCACNRCGHFENATCALASKIVQNLPAVTDELPACAIRPACRWFTQEGEAACRRCPQVVTENWHPSPVMAVVADPGVSPAAAAALCNTAAPRADARGTGTVPDESGREADDE